MGERSDRDDDSDVSASDPRELEHSRRNALQGEMLRQLVRRQQHQTHIDRALADDGRKPA